MKDSIFPIAPVTTRVFLVLFVLAAMFGIVLVFEVDTHRPAPGSELFIAPHSLIPSALTGYQITFDPNQAEFLAKQYRVSGMPVGDVSSAEISLRDAHASISAVRLQQNDLTRSTSFRAGVLAGAAGAYGIDPQAHPFHYSITNKIVVYANDAAVGNLYVWFFADAFEELFVPAAIVDEAIPLQRSVLQVETSSK